MIIHVYSYMRNEEVLLPYWLRHYTKIASCITIYDNESTDRTPELARAAGCEVIPVGTGGKFLISHLTAAFNEAREKSLGKAEWVVCAEGDEFFWAPDFLGTLRKYRDAGVTLPKVDGFQMVAQAPPREGGQIYDEIKDGAFHDAYSKRGIFNPIVNINYTVGNQFCAPWGPVVESETAEIKLLHYHCLGDDWLARRHADRKARMSEESVRNRWDVESQASNPVEWYNERIRAAKITRVLP